MKNSLKKLLALLSAMLILFSFAACGDKNDAEKTTSTTTAAVEDVDVEEDTDETDEAEEVEEDTEEDEQSEDEEDVETDAEDDTTKAKAKKSSGNSKTKKAKTNSVKKSSGEKTTKKKSTDKKTTEKTTKKKSTKKSYSAAEIVTIYNNAANLIKSEKPGYYKYHVRKAEGSTEGVSEKLISLTTVDRGKNIKKGKSSDDEYPVSGYEWASHMKASDVKTAKMEKKNGKYIISITLDKESDPKKDASKYGRVMSVIDVTEAQKITLGIVKDASMIYHDGYIKAEVDCKTGKMISAELSATADVEAVLAGGKTISVKDIKSTETFTKFEW